MTHDEILGAAPAHPAIELVGSLDREVPPGTSVAWGVGRELAFELYAAQQGGIRMGHDPPSFIGLHGERPLWAALDRRAAIACAGLGVGNVRDQIAAALADVFAGEASPALLPAAVGRAQHEAYAYVFVHATEPAGARVHDGALEVLEVARDHAGNRALVARGFPAGEPLAELVARVLRARRPSDRPFAAVPVLDLELHADHRVARARLRLVLEAGRAGVLSETSEVAAFARATEAAAPAREPFAVVFASAANGVYAAARFCDSSPDRDK